MGIFNIFKRSKKISTGRSSENNLPKISTSDSSDKNTTEISTNNCAENIVKNEFYPKKINLVIKNEEEEEFDPFSYEQYDRRMTSLGYTPLSREEFWRRHPSN